ncbi:MAG: alpha-ketoacid dehydrogenase subunit beta [Alphaproteobacteria bacterium]
MRNAAQKVDVAAARELKYADALSEGLVQAMTRDPSIFVAGIAVDYSSGIFGSTLEAVKRFGPERIFDTPAMENALTGIAIGAAAVGKRPMIVHARNDFMFLAFDQMINLAAKWRYMFGGRAGAMPLVVRAVVGRGWGQGATHSQSLHGVLAHFPGLKVVTPALPQDAKGLTIAALQADCPVVIIEHRTLYGTTGPVSEAFEPTPIGLANVVRPGRDVTIVAVSYMVVEALHAAAELEKEGISAEVVDLRTIRPLDEETVLASVRKTGRLIVADTSWELCGVVSEIAALAAEKAFHSLKAPVRRLSLADCPAPVAASLEAAFYPKASTIARAAMALTGRTSELGDIDLVDDFKGPY